MCVGFRNMLCTTHSSLRSYKTINTQKNPRGPKNTEQEQGVLGLVTDYFWTCTFYWGGINDCKCFIPPCISHLLYAFAPAGYFLSDLTQALNKALSTFNPSTVPVSSRVKMYYRSAVLVVCISNTIRNVYYGLVKFCLFLRYEQLLANVHSSYSSFPFAFFSIPSFSCFFFSFCNCLSQGNIHSLEDIRKFWNNNCKRIIMIPIIMMELIGCIDRFTKKMYHRNGNKNPFICTESLYSTSLLQHWHRFNIVGDLELIAFWHKIHNPCSFQHGVSKVLCGGIWQIPFAEDLKQN